MIYALQKNSIVASTRAAEHRYNNRWRPLKVCRKWISLSPVYDPHSRPKRNVIKSYKFHFTISACNLACHKCGPHNAAFQFSTHSRTRNSAPDVHVTLHCSHCFLPFHYFCFISFLQRHGRWHPHRQPAFGAPVLHGPVVPTWTCEKLSPHTSRANGYVRLLW